MFAPGCLDEAIREIEAGGLCSLRLTDHSKRAVASTTDGSLRVWASDEGLEFSANVHWAVGERLDGIQPRIKSALRLLQP